MSNPPNKVEGAVNVTREGRKVLRLWDVPSADLAVACDWVKEALGLGEVPPETLPPRERCYLSAHVALEAHRNVLHGAFPTCLGQWGDRTGQERLLQKDALKAVLRRVGLRKTSPYYRIARDWPRVFGRCHFCLGPCDPQHTCCLDCLYKMQLPGRPLLEIL
jgi:hypothetical protein